MTIDEDAAKAAFTVAADELVAFGQSKPFAALLEELWKVPVEFRHEFVELVVLNSEQLSHRGVVVPDGIDIQRSWFEDERPTLFCVTKRLPPGYGWKVVTITIDNPMTEVGKLGWHPFADSLTETE